MLTGSTGMAISMSCRCAWTPVTASISCGDPVSDAIARCSRESACRCSAGPAAASTAAWASASSVRCSSAQRPGGGQVAGSRLDDRAGRPASPSARRGVVGRRGTGLTGRDRRMVDDRAARPAAGGADHVGRPQGGDGLAQGGPGHPHPDRQLALRRQAAAVG